MWWDGAAGFFDSPETPEGAVARAIVPGIIRELSDDSHNPLGDIALHNTAASTPSQYKTSTVVTAAPADTSPLGERMWVLW